MNILKGKALLGIATVTDVAMHAEDRPTAAKAIASRLKLPPRHLETLLQALVHDQILDGVRGPRGGYRLARPADMISLGHVVRTALELAPPQAGFAATTDLVRTVVEPSIAAFSAEMLAKLDTTTIHGLVEKAKGLSLAAA
jgi:Rrf2 family protein